MRLRKWHFIILLLIYFFIVLFNLSSIPIAWLDEVMLIDPAHHYLQTGHFASKIWPHAGTENVFLAYLPLCSYIQIVNLFLFPDTIFFTRLSSVIALLICTFFLFKTLRNRYHINDMIIWVLIIFFLFDEGVSNAMRSGRVEILELALLSIAFYLFTIKKYPFVETICISLLLIAHPSVYPIALILFIEILLRKQSVLSRVGQCVIVTIPLLSYLYIADFNFSSIYQQLVVHGQEHDETAVGGNIFYLHFVQRFLPTYIPQPYILLLNILIHILCIYNIFVKRSFNKCLIEICFLCTSIFWFFKLAPFWRYTPVMILMMFILIPDLYKKMLSVYGYIRLNLKRSEPVQVVLIWIIILCVSVPFIVRNYTAIVQRKERNEFAVYQWLDQYIASPEENKLIIDDAIGFFYSMNREHTDFSLLYSVKKFKYDDYDKVYLLTYEDMPIEYQLVSVYRPESSEIRITNYIPQKNILTYRHLKLYEVESEEDFAALQKD